MTIQIDPFVTLEYRISELYGDPTAVAEQMASAARFAQILTAASLEVEEEGESHERWFSAEVPVASLDGLLDSLAAANVIVSVSSDEYDRDSSLAKRLATHPAVDDISFASTDADRAAQQAAIDAYKQLPLSERDPWRHAEQSRSEVRVIATLTDGSKVEGWCQVDGITDDGVRSPRLTLDDGSVVFGSECGWDYIKPYTYRPLPPASAPDSVAFDFTLQAVARTGGNAIDPAVLRETVRKALAEALSYASGQAVLGHILIGLDGKALPNNSELYDRAWDGGSDDIFDRPFDPSAPTPDEAADDEDAD